MNIVVVGAHCDDPEMCGGLAIGAVQENHRVIFLYVSSGTPGAVINAKPEAEVREAEAVAACSVIGAEAHFLRYPQRDIPFNQDTVARLSGFMGQVDADFILTHWPVDTHPDHQATGALAMQTVVGNPGVALAFYESVIGMQTLAFEPNRFVDISAVASKKKQAVDCHVSQNVNKWWPFHDKMEMFRGTQIRVSRAEGYYLAVSTPVAETIFTSREFLHPSGSRTLRQSKHAQVPLKPEVPPKNSRALH